jgi:hypothetical protein
MWRYRNVPRWSICQSRPAPISRSYKVKFRLTLRLSHITSSQRKIRFGVFAFRVLWGTYSSRDSLTSEFALNLCEGRKNVQEETSRALAVVAVDLLHDGDEAKDRPGQFLDTQDKAATLRPIQLPHNYYVETVYASGFEQSVELWSAS